VVHCLTTGGVRPKRRERGIRRYLPGGWDDRVLPVHAFLVEHPDGLCLFDCGQTARAAVAGYLPRWHPFFRLSRFELGKDDEVPAQLRSRGLDPAGVRWVVLSHLHTDHVGGIDSFPEAEVLISATEWAHAAGLAGRLRGYLPHLWPKDLRPTLVEYHGPPVGPFLGSWDLVGDGRLVLVPTPGHTPGHMALLARDGDRSFLLCGDLVHEAGELAHVAPAVDRFCRLHGVTPLATHDPRAPALLVA